MDPVDFGPIESRTHATVLFLMFLAVVGFFYYSLHDKNMSFAKKHSKAQYLDV